MATFTVTVRRTMVLEQTYTIDAKSAGEARADARELASDQDAETWNGPWRVTAITKSDVDNASSKK